MSLLMMCTTTNLIFVTTILCAIPAVFGLLAGLGSIRIGKRRSLGTLDAADDGSYVVRETGLLEQWYSDQPCQHIYAICLSGNWTSVGLEKLRNKGFVTKALLALVKRHQSLACTIQRETATNKVSVVVHSVVDLHAPQLTNKLGALPVTWVTRKNKGTWKDTCHNLTHTEMNELSWLFRVAIVLPDEIIGTASDSDNDDDTVAEIIIATHHMICDGLSSAVLIKDFVYFLACLDDDSDNHCTSSSPAAILSMIAMDEVIDLRPPLSTVIQVVGEDALPSWLRQTPIFYQGPSPNCSNTQCECHFATITLPPKIVARLTTAAKQHHLSLNGLLSAIMLVAQGQVICQFDDNNSNNNNNNDATTIPLKFGFPFGKATRQIGKISLDQVGVYVTATELIVDIPCCKLNYNHNIKEEEEKVLLWQIAKQVTQAAQGKNQIRKALEFLGLLNFLPRNSLTPWFVKDGNRYLMGRTASLTLSNLGKMEGLDELIANDHRVQRMLVVKSTATATATPEVYLCQGRGYRGAVFIVGAVTCQNTLTVSINCMLGQCGCTGPMQQSNTHEHYIATTSQQEYLDPQYGGSVECACPKDKFLYQYANLVYDEIKRLC